MNEKKMNQMAAKFVNDYGDQAYHVAVRMTVMAQAVNDHEWAKKCSEAAIELLQMGYQKFERKDR